MKTDVAIRQTRDARCRISAGVADDPVKLVEYYIAMQKRFGERLQPGPGDAWEDDSWLAEQQREADVQKDARGSRR